MHSVCQVPLKLDKFICLLHLRPCDVTIAHMYIAMTMLKRYIVQPYPKCNAVLVYNIKTTNVE